MTYGTEPRRVAHIPIQALGWSLGLFLVIAYTLGVLFALAFPGQNMTGLWAPLLPWVEGIGLGSYALDVAETLLYGWFVALIFVLFFNYLSERNA